MSARVQESLKCGDVDSLMKSYIKAKFLWWSCFILGVPRMKESKYIVLSKWKGQIWRVFGAVRCSSILLKFEFTCSLRIKTVQL
jgi:hypothetical protein